MYCVWLCAQQWVDQTAAVLTAQVGRIGVIHSIILSESQSRVRAEAIDFIGNPYTERDPPDEEPQITCRIRVESHF